MTAPIPYVNHQRLEFVVSVKTNATAKANTLCIPRTIQQQIRFLPAPSIPFAQILPPWDFVWLLLESQSLFKPKFVEMVSKKAMNSVTPPHNVVIPLHALSLLEVNAMMQVMIVAVIVNYEVQELFVDPPSQIVTFPKSALEPLLLVPKMPIGLMDPLAISRELHVPLVTVRVRTCNVHPVVDPSMS